MNKAMDYRYDLILECCRVDADTEKLEQLSSDIDDWEGFITSAYAHGVFPLVAKSLKPITSVPENIKQKLKSTNLQIARQNMTMTAELLRIMRLLEDHGINALAIKGPVLSQMIHGDIAHRQYADIDILIPRNEIFNAAKILSEHGYTSEHAIEFLKNGMLLKVGKDFSMFSPDRNIHIELHWQLFLPRQVRKSNIQLFGPDNPVCVINHQSIRTLQDDATLLYLLLHGSKHMWERIEWIVDIDRLIRQQSDRIAWERLCALATEMEIEVMYYLGLSIAYSLFHTPLPENMLQRIEKKEKVQVAKQFIVSELYHGGLLEESTKTIAFKNLYKMRLNKDSTGAVLRHYFSTLFQLKNSDIYMMNLPDALAFLYYPLRLYRMGKFYLTRSES